MVLMAAVLDILPDTNAPMFSPQQRVLSAQSSTGMGRSRHAWLLFDGGVARFEKHMIEEWEPRFGGICESLETALAAAFPFLS
jgi:hypothetical protein